MKTLVILTLGLSLVACSNLSTNSCNSKSSEHAHEYDVFKSADNHGDSGLSGSKVDNTPS
ncbi:hypothetical protein H5J22_00525 [Cetobacterium sp. 8H]|uniref:hypothetical protein n=1 Tax=Cetobacterium sp. 8H TaxID=2759681 RepID=UPI00163C73FC|nr:hypothetical protein [Cetobacterium sp. 8H]MBC2849944.1 hypothetical protein [Cetobacterium sp. 8H]